MTKFKKQLLYIKNEQVQYFTNIIETSFKNLTSFIDSVERVLKIQLTNEDKIQLKDFGVEFIEEHLRKLFQFNSASRKFNLEALGMLEIETIIEFYKKNSHNWQGYKFNLKNSSFEIPKEYFEDLIEQNSTYTEIESQNKLIEIAEKIAELHNEVLKMNVPQLKVSLMAEAGASRLLSFTKDGNGKLQVNKSFISMLAPSYKTWDILRNEKQAAREQRKKERELESNSN